MASKTSALSAVTAIADTDLLYLGVDVGGGLYGSRKITALNAALAMYAKNVISSNTNLYVATTGNDSTGDGSSGTPWLTLDRALSALNNRPLTSFVTINFADGTYNIGSAVEFHHPNGRFINLLGNTVTPANCILYFNAASGGSNGLVVRTGRTLGLVNGFTIRGTWAGSGTTGYQQSAFYVDRNANVTLGTSMILEDFYYGINANQGSFVYAPSITIDGAGDAGLFAYQGGIIIADSATISNVRDTTNNLGSGVVSEINSIVHCDSLNSTLNRKAGIHSIGGYVRCYDFTCDGNTGSAAKGIWAEAGGIIESGGTCSADSNQGDGLFINTGSGFSMYGGTLTANSNGGNGVNFIGSNGHIVGLTATGNTSSGIRGYGGSRVNASAATLTGNSLYGFDVFQNTALTISGSTINTNTLGAGVAQMISSVLALSSTITGTLSPTANATGNQNSWIRTT